MTHHHRTGRTDPLVRRRALLAAALGLPLAPFLASCSSYDDPVAAGTSASASGSSPAWEPATVEHAFGSTTVEKRPTRVLSAGYTEQDFLLALGVVPVGVTDWYGDQPFGTWPWAQAALGDAEPTLLNTNDGFQFLEISALRPDLIIAPNAGMTQADYDELTAIAPTVAQPPGTSFFPSWRDMLAMIGGSLGLADEAAELERSVSARFTDAREANAELTGNAIFLQNAVYDGNLIAYQKGLSTDFLTDLGFDVPAAIDEYVTDDGGQAYIPLERIDVLDAADWLIWGTESDADRTALEALPGFDRLRAVQAGQTVYTGGELAGAIYFTSPLSLPYVVDELVPLLVAAAG